MFLIFLKFALTCRDSTNVVDAWMRRNDHSRLFAEEMILI
jgi:hypothetical protein